MTPYKPLDQIRLFEVKSHTAAVWWLWVLYRDPARFQEALRALSWGRAVLVGATVYFHGLPYAIFLALVLNAAAHLVAQTSCNWHKICVGILLGMVGGVVVGICGGISGRITSGIAGAIAIGMCGGVTFGIAGEIANAIAGGITVGIAGGIVIGTPVQFGVGIAIGSIIGLAFGIGGGVAVGFAAGIAGTIASLRAYYVLAHPFFIWPAARGRLYPFHPVAWDHLCSVPFPGLDRLLVAYTQIEIETGIAEIDRITTHPSQRMQALRARVRLLAHDARAAQNLVCLSNHAILLPRGTHLWLDQSGQVAEGIREIALLQAKLNSAQRPMLREPLSENLLKEIENFRHRISRFDEPLASEFRSAALEWEKIAQRQLDEARSLLNRKAIRQVFRAGDPVDRDSEAFVCRDAVVGRLDQQITSATGSPGIVLYARRRMGKSTMLTNLDGFLPSTITTRLISMLDPTAFSSLQHFTERISSGNAIDLPSLSRYLSNENERLKAEGRRLLLAIDEYENVDTKIGEGVFPADLLAAVRESIQQHRHITWLFAGSHEITELPHAEWTSFLVSARTIEIPPFTLDETRMLLTDPLRHSRRHQQSEERPIFSPTLWGPGGIERIHAEADGWPHLLQLIAEVLVGFPHSEDAPAVSLELMERALDEAVVSGQNVLYQLVHGECSLGGEWEYLVEFRHSEEQKAPKDEAIRRSLLRRQLIRVTEDRWSLRVPLMARWLRTRG